MPNLEIRDLLAASALQGIAARPRTVGSATDPRSMAREAYALADAALEVRDEPELAAVAPAPKPAVARRGPIVQQRPPAPVVAAPPNESTEGKPPPSFQGFKPPPTP
jgi:hypothetical protein